MKKEHYPSLELCKKLTEAGFPKTEYFWKDYTQGDKKQQIVNCGRYEMEHGLYVYSCPSVMELLDEMPESILDCVELHITNYGCWYASGVMNDDGDCTYTDVKMYRGTPPNSLAEMWLWLKENNYLIK